MTKRRGWLFAALVGACVAGVSGGTCLAATRYVYTNSPSPGGGYTSWATAAHSIQDAIDAATVGDTVMVTNGVYATGGRVVSINGPAGIRSGPTNRVVVDKAIMVTSVNGPESTHIVGQGPPGSNAVRCVYLAGGATVSGFTLRDGASKSFQGLTLGESCNGIVDSGGGVYCSDVTAVVSNCVVTGCLAAKGGGGYQGTWVACEITRNLVFCNGGGVANATLNRCVVTDNTAHNDLGSGQANGGGISGGSACNTYIAGNQADTYGGGSYESALTNVTMVFNTGKYNGGSFDYTAVNSIIYYNNATASDYYAQRNVSHQKLGKPPPSYTCTTPAPAGGTMNITNPPTLCSTRNPRLFASSPGIDAGNNAAASGATDLSGGPRILGSAVDMGCVEYSNGPHTGLLTVAIEPPEVSTTVGTELTLEARISGDPVASCWEWAGQAVSNAFLVQVSFADPGDHPVVLRVTNATMSAIATAWVHVAQSDFAYYASPTGTHLYPFTSLATAATNIQDAINAAAFDGATVWVDKGLYDNSVTNIDGLGLSRIALMRPIVVRSLHGPAETVICGSTGEPPVRCAYVGAGAQLIGLTLTGGSASTNNVNYSGYGLGYGGGAFCQGGVISGCVVRANRASFGGGVGGIDSFIYDSIIESNCATYDGGGAADGVVVDRCRVAWNRAGGELGGCSRAFNSLIVHNYSGIRVGGVNDAVNCTIVGNRCGVIGGGTSGGNGYYGLTRAMNCINYDNDAVWSGPNTWDHWEWGEESPVACVTWPAGDANTITNPPLIVSLDNPNLLPGSPAIDGGLMAHTNSYGGVTRAPETADLDGKARIENGRVDIGCIEFDASSLTGRLSVAILPMATQCATRASVSFETSIAGRPTGYTWDFGDGTTLPNLYRAWHSFAAPGRYDVVLTVSNLTDRASATVTVEVVETAYYVSPDGTHTPPFTNWATAAHDIQSAIDAATVIGATVWVAPGDYATGGRAMSDLSIYDSQNANRVAVFKPLTIRSTGGPDVTRIVGSGTNGPERTRGVYLTDYSSLIGFTVTNGYANTTGGGGIFCEPRAIVSNCVIVGNVGATVGGRIYDSRIARNIASEIVTAQVAAPEWAAT